MSLDRFAATISTLIHCTAEERDSVNFPEGYYFRLRLENAEIMVQIADDTDHPDSDFLVWVPKGDDEIRQHLLAGIADHLHREGYAVETDL